MIDIDLSAMSSCACCGETCPFNETLYITYSCGPDCDARNGTFELVKDTPPYSFNWFTTSNPTGCDCVDVLSCDEQTGSFSFTSCCGSSPAPGPVPVNVVSRHPLVIEVGPWVHQAVNLCGYPDGATCTATITE